MSRRRSVVVDLFGGLGNQLFQYTAGLALARLHEADLFVRDQHSVGVRDFLATEVDLAPVDVVRRLALYRPQYSSYRSVVAWSLRAVRRSVDSGALTFVERSSHDVQPAELSTTSARCIGLHGYFQHPSWYEPVLHEVIASVNGSVSSALRAAGSDGALAEIGPYTVATFRRGDYVPLGWPLPVDYYRRALAALPRRQQPLFVVGDDPLIVDLARSWDLLDGFDVRPLPDLGVEPRIRDLALTGGAAQVVMANSTFSWWGAVLGEAFSAVEPSTALDRVVIAPASWTESVAGSSVLVRANWVRQ